MLIAPKLETTQMSLNRWMDQQIVVYLYNGIVLIRVKWRTNDTCNIDEPQNIYPEGKKAHKKVHTVWFHINIIIDNSDKFIVTLSVVV